MRPIVTLVLVGICAGESSAQALVHSFIGHAQKNLYGASVACLGDIDGDGCDDVAAGAPMYDSVPGNEPYVEVRSGRTGALLATLTSPMQPAFDTAFGFSMSGDGDADGDGTRDLLVSAPHGGNYILCRLYVFSGRTLQLITTVNAPPVAEKAVGFGASLDYVGDLDGDGGDDFAATSELSPFGRVRIYSGKTGALMKELVAPPGQPAFQYPRVAGAGDTNQDGTDDIVVTDPQSQSIYVFSGKNFSLLLTSHPGGDSGVSIDSAGDTNLDGRPDLIAGAPQANKILVLSGLTGFPLLAIVSPWSFSNFGGSVGPAGDVDEDGVPDVFGATYLHTPTGLGDSSFGGVLRVHSGATGAHLLSRYGKEYGFGWPTHFAGDVNGDGKADLIAGSTEFKSGGQLSVGRADIVSTTNFLDLGGASIGPVAAATLTADGNLVANTKVTLHVDGAAPYAPVVFVFGIVKMNKPAFDGTIVPKLQWVTPPVFTDHAGQAAFSGRAEELPQHFVFYMQAAVLDPTDLDGVVLTNALSATAP